MVFFERMKFKMTLVALAVLLAMMAFTNPTVEQFRGHIREREGLAGTLGLLAADLLVLPEDRRQKGGVQRESFVLFSRFYIGGDGLLPRQDVAWGALGRFWDTKPEAERGGKK